jgi:hypothetical protein
MKNQHQRRQSEICQPSRKQVWRRAAVAGFMRHQHSRLHLVHLRQVVEGHHLSGMPLRPVRLTVLYPLAGGKLRQRVYHLLYACPGGMQHFR